MTKIVYNDCYGGFGLSKKGKELYEKISGSPLKSDYDLDRTDPILIRVVEEGGANDSFASLQIAEVPEGTLYRIDEYDGMERVMTVDDYEWSIA